MSLFIPPDWRDATAYPKKRDDWALDKWAWEFLRRNPDYQKDYEHFASLPSYRPNGAKTVKWSCTATIWWHDPRLRYCKHPILPDEDTIAEYFHRTGDDTPFHYSLEDHLIEKWGFTSELIYDPAYDDAGHGLEYTPELPKPIGYKYFDQEKGEFIPHQIEPEDPYEYTLRFDLRYSIDKQLLEAKEILQGKKQSRFHILEDKMMRYSAGVNIDNLPMYLRAYDAKQAGFTYLEIGKELFPTIDQDGAKQRAFNAFKKGEELVQEGYRELMKSS